MSERSPAIRVIMLPRDTNAQGTIFGGAILAQLDLAGAAIAQGHRPHRYVTVAIHEVEFIAPVYVGDVVSFYGHVASVGRTSLTVHVDVEAQRISDPSQVVKVTEADLVYVAIDPAGRPVPVDGP